MAAATLATALVAAGCAGHERPVPRDGGEQVAASGQAGGEARGSVEAAPSVASRTPPHPSAPAEPSLGVRDRGIYADLDPRVQIALPPGLADAELVVVADHRLAVLYHAGFPLKAYPLGGPAELAVGDHRLALRPGDRAELAALPALRARALAAGEAPPPGDRDRDGLPDPLDVLIGALKNALNAAPYVGGYRRLPFPGGDVPRDEGVCTDVVVRAARNAGLDLQDEVHRDIARAPRAYPMVTRPNASIDHRRVKTVLPYFVRRWTAHTAAIDDPADPLRPGDVIFMDTFPDRPGPDHIGVIGARRGEGGRPLVVNAWTDGYLAGEMDLLGSIPVTHRFRIPPP